MAWNLAEGSWLEATRYARRVWDKGLPTCSRTSRSANLPYRFESLPSAFLTPWTLSGFGWSYVSFSYRWGISFLCHVKKEAEIKNDIILSFYRTLSRDIVLWLGWIVDRCRHLKVGFGPCSSVVSLHMRDHTDQSIDLLHHGPRLPMGRFNGSLIMGPYPTTESLTDWEFNLADQSSTQSMVN